MRTLALFALAVLALASCKPKESRLAPKVKARLEAADAGLQVSITDEHTLAVKAGEIELTMSLDNLERACAQGGAEVCEGTVERQVKAALAQLRVAADGAKAIDPKDVRLTVKDPSWMKAVAEAQKRAPPEKRRDNALVSRAFVGPLTIVYVADMPDGMRMITQSDLKALDLSENALDALARKNLAEAALPLEVEELAGAGVFTNAVNDDYTSAMLVLPEMWRSLAQKVKGRLLVGMPARNRFFAAAESHQEVLRKVTRSAAEKEDHPLTDDLYVWSEKGFSHFLP